MAMNEMLIALSETEHNSIYLNRGRYGGKWYCSFEHDDTDFKIEFREEADTPEEAVRKTYDRFIALGKGPVKEIAPQMLRAPDDYVPDLPAYAGQHDVQPPLDDEAPF